MPRYDLMPWSVRVRDQQTAYARSVAPEPVVAPPPIERPSKPRVARPKPPRDEDADNILRLCREGRLFELQRWIAAGKPLTVPAHDRHTPLRVAVDTGFHSLIDLLLQHGADQAAKDDVLEHACWEGVARPPNSPAPLARGAPRSLTPRPLRLSARPVGLTEPSVRFTMSR
jgi:hypothetical protein